MAPAFRGADAQARLVQISDDRLDPLLGLRPPAFDQLRQPRLRVLADEHVDVTLTAQQALDEVAPDEAGGARYEVGHGASLPTAPASTCLPCSAEAAPDPPRQAPHRPQRDAGLAASMRACLRFSSRHWINEKMMMIVGKKRDRDEHHVGDGLVGGLAVPTLAATAVRERGRGEHEQRSGHRCQGDDQSCTPHRGRKPT